MGFHLVCYAHSNRYDELAVSFSSAFFGPPEAAFRRLRQRGVRSCVVIGACAESMEDGLKIGLFCWPELCRAGREPSTFDQLHFHPLP